MTDGNVVISPSYGLKLGGAFRGGHGLVRKGPSFLSDHRPNNCAFQMRSRRWEDVE